MLRKELEFQRYFIELAYHGKAYHGWQIQPNALSVQETLTQAISTILRGDVSIAGAGRTDTGVHASHFVAHFDWFGKPLFTSELQNKLNRYLPRNIRIDRIQLVDSDSHSRFSAIKRTYHYLICQEKNPFLNDYSWFVPNDLDIQLMNDAAKLLLKTKDFTSFARLHADTKTNICDLSKAIWSEKGKLLVFEISADRFLRNMVRAIVGSLVEVGKKKTSLDDFASIIHQLDRSAAGQSAPAQGLFLSRIDYPSDIFRVNPQLCFPELF